ncbi:dihydrodipicolinate synthetase-like protein [Lizonia empirigonia]|nr:dihydrodipicolinate synthetase-like protein [Lizonia empirigonia]
MSLNGNGVKKERTPLRAGVYSPTMTFFDPETEELDVATIKKHAVRLAEAGLVGLVTMGSNGEAVHLSRAEKQTVTRATREALDEAGYKNVPVIVGASEHGIKLTIELAKEAAEAGGEYILTEAIEEYFTKVADASPLPIIIYNYPGAVSGIDIDSDLLIKLGKHPNIVGTKFTCGNTGKLTRVAYALNAVSTKSEGSGYMALGGIADFTAQTAACGGSGIIAGGANVIPKTCVKVWNLCAEGKLEEAFELQKKLSKGDWVLTKAAIPGTKSAIQSYFGYGGYPRRPLKRLSKEKTDAVAEGIKEIMEIEMSL